MNTVSESVAGAGHGWVELDDQCVVSFRGSAAHSFLGRQLTCDIGELTAERPLFGALLTPKGRVLVLLRLIHRAADQIDAIVPTALRDELIQRLRMFVMRDDVAIEADTEQQVIGIWGDCVALFADAVSRSAQLRMVPISSRPPLALLPGSPKLLQSVLDGNSASRGDFAHWRRLCIEAGLPQVDASTRESFIPQMINLDRLGAVSFSKGCYPGQEIVARTQHLGRIKRRMFIVRALDADANEAVQAGDVIVGAHGEDIGGRVVSVGRETRDLVMLAVLPLDSDSATDKVRIGDASGSVLEVSSPPYPLTDPAG